ncbi:MAG TPA: hypothetical protein VJ873_05545 [bacterium]|nr:hypothetical protein [bacterium]
MNRSLLKRAFALFLAINLAGFTCPLFIPKAHALYWEDEGDDDNNPSEVKQRPDHFSLFDWVGDLDKDAKKKNYQQMDNHDRGPDVNNGARAQVLIASGIVGLATGLFLANEFSGSNSNVSSNMFIGGAVGLGAGIGIGALIMPGDYNVDQVAQTDFLKQREAWLQDPVRLQVARAFTPPQVAFSVQF